MGHWARLVELKQRSIDTIPPILVSGQTCPDATSVLVLRNSSAGPNSGGGAYN